ncbi:aspartate/glutamate racemase family protein [Roseomonas sp. AR75]|uniref:aspartate/glutamate racemase family protein n=1 Tax=Roseomonas sp. AR75 TaxID=2562311 RepID=UPI0010C1051D|nr:aspartate/glutamate racemase family protein [Roseomonas sp. AR75]
MKIGLIGATQAPVAGLGAPAELVAIAALGTAIQAFPTRMPIFAHTEVEFAMQALNSLDAGLAAQDAGCDAVVINSVSDYGIAALASALDIPVVGAAEASFRFVGTLGPRFTLVTVWPESTNYMPRRMLRDYGAEAACARIRNVGTEDILAGEGKPDGFVSDLQHGKGAILDRIVDACLMAAREDEADAVVLGCTCMSPIAALIAARCPLPVVNPLAVALKTAEMQAALGLKRSRRGQGTRRLGALARARAMVQAGAGFGAAPAEEEADCPVCVVGAAE